MEDNAFKLISKSEIIKNENNDIDIFEIKYEYETIINNLDQKDFEQWFRDYICDFVIPEYRFEKVEENKFNLIIVFNDKQKRLYYDIIEKLINENSIEKYKGEN